MVMRYYEKIGDEKLRKIVDVFVEKLYSNIIIGYLFRNIDKENLKQREFELIANVLGANLKYKGRNLRIIHQKHYIREGQFNIRQKLLKETLEEFNVEKEIVEGLIQHNEKLKKLIITKN
jgi:truncated hemoglobin YjbI